MKYTYSNELETEIKAKKKASFMKKLLAFEDSLAGQILMSILIAIFAYIDICLFFCL